MIRTLRFFISAVTIAAVLASCATIGTGRTAYDKSLDGLWQGSITLRNTPEDILDLRVLINQETARVFLQIGGTWIEAKPGAFHVSRGMSNAVIYATDSGVDSDGTWVESWAVIATSRSSDSILVVWSRVVNNLNLPLENESSKYAEHASGVLHRIPAGA